MCQISSNFVNKYRNCYKFNQVHTVKYESQCSNFDENHTSSTAVQKLQFNSGYWRLRRYIYVIRAA